MRLFLSAASAVALGLVVVAVAVSMVSLLRDPALVKMIPGYAIVEWMSWQVALLVGMMIGGACQYGLANGRLA